MNTDDYSDFDLVEKSYLSVGRFFPAAFHDDPKND